jgi:hypothetical protein
MTTRTPDRIWSGIEVTKVIAGTLAAVTAAVVGSFLGVAGTLAGAAVASVVGSVGTEIYQRSLHHGAKRLGRFTPTFVTAPAAVGTPPVAAADEPQDTAYPRPEFRWRHVAVAAAALFVLAMGSLTVFELVAGKSVASTVGNQTSSGTSVGSLLGGDRERSPAVTPSPAGSPADRQQPAPSEPAGDDAPTGPAQTAPAPTAPAPTGTTPPVTEPTAVPPTGTPPQQPQEEQDGPADQLGSEQRSIAP